MINDVRNIKWPKEGGDWKLTGPNTLAFLGNKIPRDFEETSPGEWVEFNRDSPAIERKKVEDTIVIAALNAQLKKLKKT